VHARRSRLWAGQVALSFSPESVPDRHRTNYGRTYVRPAPGGGARAWSGQTPSWLSESQRLPAPPPHTVVRSPILHHTHSRVCGVLGDGVDRLVDGGGTRGEGREERVAAALCFLSPNADRSGSRSAGSFPSPWPCPVDQCMSEFWHPTSRSSGGGRRRRGFGCMPRRAEWTR
jgi:hypothetical protein